MISLELCNSWGLHFSYERNSSYSAPFAIGLDLPRSLAYEGELALSDNNLLSIGTKHST